MKFYTLPILVVTVLSILFLGSSTTYAYVPKTADISMFAVVHDSTVVYHPSTFIGNRIKAFEGFSSTKYKCSVSGVLLQGYGKSIGKNKTPSRISKATASNWLHDDITKCENQLDQYLPWWRELSPVRQAAMIDLTYNMGIFKLLKFKNFLKNMEQGNYTKAKKCLLTGKDGKSKSKYYKQVGIRAIEVSTAIATDAWIHMKNA